MRVLTDTHTLVWSIISPEKVGAKAREQMKSFGFTASVANLWELVLKARKKGALIAEPLSWWVEFISTPQIPTLDIGTAHIRALAGLPDHHEDPFDRILVAQAMAEGLTLATKDAALAFYGVQVVWD